MRDVLPPLPPPPVLDPRPGDWETLRGRAALRMHRRYAAGGAVLSLALLATVLLTGAFRNPASLHIHEPTRPGPSPSAPRRAEAEPPVPGGPLAPGSSSPTAAPVRTPAPPPPFPPPSGRPTVAPPPPPRPPGYTRTESSHAGGTAVCNPTANTAWCFRRTNESRARAGLPADYVFEICNVAETVDPTLRFETTREFTFDVADGVATRWSWERGRRFESPGPAVEVPVGRCARWSVTWDATDDAGAPLPAGDYHATVVLHASTGGSPPGESFTLEVYE